MAIIVIRDLPENVELDRQAMLAIIGGARRRSSGVLVRPAGKRIVSYPMQKAPPRPPSR
ncbi:MAG: hypothetical protein V4508_13120 [Pseudomonadota bacterium]